MDLTIPVSTLEPRMTVTTPGAEQSEAALSLLRDGTMTQILKVTPEGEVWVNVAGSGWRQLALAQPPVTALGVD